MLLGCWPGLLPLGYSWSGQVKIDSVSRLWLLFVACWLASLPAFFVLLCITYISFLASLCGLLPLSSAHSSLARFMVCLDLGRLLTRTLLWLI